MLCKPEQLMLFSLFCVQILNVLTATVESRVILLVMTTDMR